MKNIYILIRHLSIPAEVSTACVQLDRDFVFTEPRSYSISEAVHVNTQLPRLLAKGGQQNESGTSNAQLWLRVARVAPPIEADSDRYVFPLGQSQRWASVASHFLYEYEQRLQPTK